MSAPVQAQPVAIELLQELLDEYMAVIQSAYCQCDEEEDLTNRVRANLAAPVQAQPVASSELLRRVCDVLEGLEGKPLGGAMPARVAKLRAAVANAETAPAATQPAVAPVTSILPLRASGFTADEAFTFVELMSDWRHAPLADSKKAFDAVVSHIDTWAAQGAPAVAPAAGELPPLPVPWQNFPQAPEGSRDHYAADQMHDYARAALASQAAAPAQEAK